MLCLQNYRLTNIIGFATKSLINSFLCYEKFMQTLIFNAQLIISCEIKCITVFQNLLHLLFIDSIGIN